MTADDALSFAALTAVEVPIKIVDVGANPIDGPAPYASCLRHGAVELVGFEPNRDALARLDSLKGPGEVYLSHAVGDGRRHALHVCQAPGMTSLLKPDATVLDLFHGFPEWGRVVDIVPVQTVRLDDVAETAGLDLLKIDIQGAELMVFRNALDRLDDATVIQTEVEFLPLYEGQPLFSEVEQFLRAAGFMLHRFVQTASRIVRPLTVPGDPYAGLGQLVWADAVFIKDVSRLGRLSDRQLLAMSRILHEGYRAIDIVVRLLAAYDARHATQLQATYIGALQRETLAGQA